MKLYIALPAINELDYIHNTIDCLSKQKTCHQFSVFVCVNQPEEYWNINSPLQRGVRGVSPILQSNDFIHRTSNICIDNQKTIEYLKSVKSIPITIIDRSSKGKGMEEGKTGVGWARKITMDAINDKANDEDIIISLDADTVFSEDYIESIAENFSIHPDAVGMSIPYYHKLTGNQPLDRALLRYEIYMRHYLINLFRINSPYSFTALGSAIALPAKAYRAIKGMTPKKSGEDFYFLQKLVKYGKVIIRNEEHAYPSTRFSDRVLFGTGPALIKGSKGDRESYPVYDFRLFDNIYKTYSLFADLFKADIETPMSDFIRQQFKDENTWHLLRKNNPDISKFIKACHIKIDGLRILQYLKQEQQKKAYSDEANLKDFLLKFYKDAMIEENIDTNGLSFAESEISELNKIRNLLTTIENKLRKEKKFITINNFIK